MQQDPAAFMSRVEECVRDCDTELYSTEEEDFDIRCDITESGGGRISCLPSRPSLASQSGRM